ncbi:hypothetical protein CR513_22731, partial [Mucuna pruriens]
KFVRTLDEIPTPDRIRYCNRKGDVFTNVLVVCDPNLVQAYDFYLKLLYIYFFVDHHIEGLHIISMIGLESLLKITKSCLISIMLVHERNRKVVGILKKDGTKIRIINTFLLHNFIRDEQQSDELLEVQDLELLSIVDEELTNQPRKIVQNNVTGEVTTMNRQDFEIH